VLLIPLAAIVIMNVDLGYWVYYLKLRGHFFVAAIGTTLAVAAVWLFRLLPAKYYLRPLYIFICTGVLYPLIGFYGLLAALLMGVLVWRLEKQTPTARVIVSLVAVLSIVFWPLFCYNYVFCQTGIHNIWWTGLPMYWVDKELPGFYIPYYILVASLIFLALMFGMWEKKRTQESSPKKANAKKQNAKSGKLKELPVRWLLIHVAIVIAAGYSVHRFWFKDPNFHKEFRMQQCMENLDWEGVLREAVSDGEEPTRAIVMMRNLALFRLGRQGDEMYHYPDGSKPCNEPVPVRMMQVVGYSMYYNYGLANYCHRWCLEQGVEFGFRAEYLKYLMRCALVNGETQEARKYASLLKHTRYHKAWAEKQEQFLHHRDKMQADAEYAPLFHLRDFKDQLGSDNGLVEYFLMHLLVNVDTEDPLMQELVLFAALWTKDIATFWPRFTKYAILHTGQPMPRHYQEAAFLYGNLEHNVDISKMPFDPQVVKDYQDFMALAQRCAGMTEAQMRPVFYPKFGHTFYYDYFLIRNQKLY
jgi:hypothetical protein